MELLGMNIRLVSAVVTGASVLFAGCSASHVDFTPSQDHQSLESSEFLHFMAQEPMVTCDQVGRAALLLADGEETAMTYDERVAELKSRGIFREDWDYEAGDVVSRGMLAYVILKVCQMPGGINTFISGLTGIGCERYALKEITRQGIVRYGFPYELPTGGEVARALARADDYMARRGLYESSEGELNSPEDLE